MCLYQRFRPRPNFVDVGFYRIFSELKGVAASSSNSTRLDLSGSLVIGKDHTV